MRPIPRLLALLVLFLCCRGVPGATAGPYTADRVVFSGGQSSSVAVGYRLTGGAGQPLVTSSGGGAYALQSGFWALPPASTTEVPAAGGPLVTRLVHSGPNPFTSRAEIAFELAAPQRVSIEVFDLRGARVRTLVDRAMDPGRYRLPWDGRDADGAAVPAGVYWIQFLAGGTRQGSRIVRLP